MVVVSPCTTMPREAPTRAMSTPASSMSRAIVKSYAVTIAIFSPLSLRARRSGTVTFFADEPLEPYIVVGRGLVAGVRAFLLGSLAPASARDKDGFRGRAPSRDGIERSVLDEAARS